MIAQWTELTPLDIENLGSDLSSEITVLFLPIGAPEGHGPALPLGVKTWHAEQQSLAIAENLQAQLPQWNFIILPNLPLTVDGVTSKYTLSVRGHVVRDALVDQVEHLKRLGFLNFAVVAPQCSPRQLSAIEEACKMVSRSQALMVSLSSMLVNQKKVMSSPMIALPSEHGGSFDSGLVKKFFPNWKPLVTSEVNSGSAQTKEPKPSMSRWWKYFRNELHETWSSGLNFEIEWPRQAQEIATAYRSVLESGKSSRVFQSGYRWFLFNGSFFKAYILAALFFVLMVVWSLWSLKDVFEP